MGAVVLGFLRGGNEVKMKSTKEKIERVTSISGRDGRGLIVIHGLYVCRDIWVTDRNLLSEQEDEDQG